MQEGPEVSELKAEVLMRSSYKHECEVGVEKEERSAVWPMKHRGQARAVISDGLRNALPVLIFTTTSGSIWLWFGHVVR